MFARQPLVIVLLSVAALSIFTACAAPTQEELTPQPTQESPTAVVLTATPETPPPTPVEPAPTSPAATGDSSAAGAGPIAGHSLRVVTFNTHLLSPMFQCGVPAVPAGEQILVNPCYVLNELGETTAAHAHAIANVLDDGTFDILALNEVWDEDDGKDVLVDRLQGVYPHYVKLISV